MKRTRKWFIIALFILVLSKGIRTQTDGVSFAKTVRCMEAREEWETASPVAIDPMRYTYLGSGVQFYAFLSEDGTTVLKLFKHYHIGPPTPLLKKLPFTASVVEAREKRMESIFKSALFSASHCRKETGVVALQINPSKKLLPILEVKDKIGVRHHVDLNRTPFVLQRHADPFFETLETLSPSEIAKAISQLVETLKTFDSSDHLLSTNYGFCEKVPCAIDIGSLKKRVHPATKRDLYFLTLQLRQWLEQRYPQQIPTLDEAIG
ncbi:MAG: hypothetical protein K940chlam2_00827 [Chlamydiae bacterium]|nr:hypothetical protein [Chlamydiota bacterium]